MRGRGAGGEKAGLLGALATGALASACCLGPLVFVSLGIGSASLFVSMAPYRPVFAVLTLLLLAFAAWRHYVGRRECLARGCRPKRPLLLLLLGGLSVLVLIFPVFISYLIQ